MFCGTKRMCDQLAMNLSREYRAAAIHGDKKQQERDAVLAAFKVRLIIERRHQTPIVQKSLLVLISCVLVLQM